MKSLNFVNRYSRYGIQFCIKNSPLSIPNRKNINSMTFQPNLFMRPFASSSMTRPVVIGGSNVDLVITALEKIQLDGRFLQGSLNQCCGGVGRNIAYALACLQTNPLFISAIGCDDQGSFVFKSMKNMETKGIFKTNTESTACACVIVDVDKECKFIIGHLDIHYRISIEWIKKFESELMHSSFVVLDGNLHMDSIDYVLSICKAHNIPVWFEPTDVAIAHRIFESRLWETITHVSPNLNELKRMCSFFTGKDYSHLNPTTLDDVIKISIDLAKNVKIKVRIVTLGKFGLLMITDNDVKHFEALPIDKIENTSGAGDCAVAGYIAAHLQNFDENQKIAAGLFCARESLFSSTPVPSNIKLQTPKVNFKIIKYN